MDEEGERDMERDTDEQIEAEWAQAEVEDVAAQEAAAIAAQAKKASEMADRAMRCPSCWKTAEVRHCRICKWLVCRTCNLTWDPHTGRSMPSGRDLSATFQVGDPRDDGTIETEGEGGR